MHHFFLRNQNPKKKFRLERHEIIHPKFSHALGLALHVLSPKTFSKKEDSSILKIEKGFKTQYTDYRYICEPNPQHSETQN